MQENGTPAKVPNLLSHRNVALLTDSIEPSAFAGGFFMPILGGNNMKCPYAVNRKTVSQTTFYHDENGVQVFQQTIEDNQASFPDCLMQECGAWKDGRCCYHE